MPPTLCVYVPLHFCCSVQTDPTLLHISIENQLTVNIYLPYYSKISASNKYVPQMPYVCHMPKVLDKHQWGSSQIYMLLMKPCVQECHTKITMTKTPVTTMTPMMMTIKSNYISCLGNLPTYPKPIISA